MTSVIESATGIGKCDNFTTKCDRYFKVQQNLPHHRRLNENCLAQSYCYYTKLCLKILHGKNLTGLFKTKAKCILNGNIRENALLSFPRVTSFTTKYI